MLCSIYGELSIEGGQSQSVCYTNIHKMAYFRRRHLLYWCICVSLKYHQEAHVSQWYIFWYYMLDVHYHFSNDKAILVLLLNFTPQSFILPQFVTNPPSSKNETNNHFGNKTIHVLLQTDEKLLKIQKPFQIQPNRNLYDLYKGIIPLV